MRTENFSTGSTTTAGRFIGEHPNRRTISYEERNPLWLSGGVEADTPKGKVIRWSQPTARSTRDLDFTLGAGNRMRFKQALQPTELRARGGGKSPYISGRCIIELNHARTAHRRAGARPSPPR